MARGRKPKVRINEEQLDKARKKLKSTPKRGRWPKFSEIHKDDRNDYIDCFQTPSKVFSHSIYKNACFAKECTRGGVPVLDENFGIALPNEYKIIGTIRFSCTSYDPHGGSPLIDTTCLLRCERTSCPYFKKGFITETLKNKTFDGDIVTELNRRHNVKQINQELEENA